MLPELGEFIRCKRNTGFCVIFFGHLYKFCVVFLYNIELHCIFAHAFENPQNVFSRGMGYFLIVYQLLHFLCTDAGVYAVMQRFTMLISCLYGVFIG